MMTIPDACAVAVAAVLVVSASAKAVSPLAAAPLLAAVRLPFPRVLSAATIPAELALVVGILVGVGQIGMVSVLLSGLLFLGGGILAAIAMRRHAGVSCGCFGSLSVAPVSRGTLVRNFGLEALAAVAVLSAHPLSASFVRPAGVLAVAVLMVGCVIVTVIAALVLRRHRRGQRASSTTSLGPTGSVRVVVSPHCAQCVEVVRLLSREPSAKHVIREFVSLGTPTDTRVAFGDVFAFRYIEREVFKAEHDVIGTPVALIERAGQETEKVYGEFQILQLFASSDAQQHALSAGH